MSKSETDPKEPAPEKAKPAAGPGVTAWLSGLLPPGSAVKPESAPAPEAESGALRIPLDVAALLPENDAGSLCRISVRDLAEGIRFTDGTDEGRGRWSFLPNQLNGLAALVHDHSILPHALTLRADFETDDGAAWTEMLSFTLRDGDTPGAAAPSALPKVAAPPPPPESVRPHVFTVTDLDVSLGIDDPDVLAGIELIFAGLPEGASISGGSPGEEGTWRLPATALDNLAAIVPSDTRAFDLKVSVVGSEDDEAASFPILPLLTAPLSPLIRIGAPAAPEATRFKIFTDGVQAADYLVDWSDSAAGAVDLVIPLSESGELPFEILVRYGGGGASASSGPLLLSVLIDGNEIPSDAPGIVARGSLAAGGGKRWQGDLIIGVREALRSAERQTPVPDDLPPKPAPPQVESEAALRTIDVFAEADATEPAPSPSAKEDDVPTLVLRTAPDDIRRPEFLRELDQLGSFIRSPEGDEEHRIYERLGLDVGRWRDMAVFGPSGEPVDTAPMIPGIAPPGGRDNARGFSRLDKWFEPTPDTHAVLVEGLPPGAMLSRGTNLGDGRWRLTKDDVPFTSVIGPIGENTTVPATITGLDERGNPVERTGRHSVLMGTIADTLRPQAFGMRAVSFNLSADPFDPKDFGTLSLTIGDMPPGTIVVGGSNHGGGVWTLDAACGGDLQVLAAGQSQPFKLTLTCIALDKRSGDSTVVTRALRVVPNNGTIETVSNAA